MNKPELYQKTVDILVDAYFNDTLKHGICQACAVGNIVAYYTNQKCEGKYYCSDFSWSGLVLNSRSILRIEDGIKKSEEQIIATGYSCRDLLKIERAFESAPKGNSAEDWMFNGLMAVIEVLDKIHNNTDSDLTSSTKSRFNKSLVN